MVYFFAIMSIMDRQNSSKINQLLRLWPRGTVAVSSWLSDQGVSRQLVDSYRKTHWLVAVGRGAFQRADDKPDWLGGVYAIQEQLGLSIHPAGKTALELQGSAHFLPIGKNAPGWLFGKNDEKLPAWFAKANWSRETRYVTNHLFSKEKLGMLKKDIEQFSIALSSPERAALEAVHLVPHSQSFEEAKSLIEGLTTLRPNLVQDLLENCKSIKAKRLFLYLAESSNHPWLKKLELSKVKLGSGKRSIIPGGKLDSKYQITVPRSES